MPEEDVFLRIQVSSFVIEKKVYRMNFKKYFYWNTLVVPSFVLLFLFVAWGMALALPSVKLMAVGDSITLGIGSEFEDGYRKRLFLSLVNAGYRVDLVGSQQDGQFSSPFFDDDHEGHPNWTSSDVRIHMYDWLVDYDPDIVLLHIGTNGVSPDVSEVAAILDEVDRYSETVSVLLARIINRSSYHNLTAQFNDNLELMAVQRQLEGDLIVVVDMESALDYPQDMSGFLHPNDSGYAKMADRWYQAIETVLGAAPLHPPEILDSKNEEMFLGESYQFDVDAFGNPAPAYTLESGPPGMSIDAITGLLSWTPDSVGTFPVTVEAQNSEGEDSRSFVIEVTVPPPLPGGLVSYWKLNQAGGVVFFDATGLNDGLCAASCPQAVAGRVNGGQLFDGTNGVNVAADSSFDLGVSDSFSVEFWMRKESSTFQNEPAMARDDRSSQMHWWVGVGHVAGPGKARFFARDSAGNGFGVSGTTMLTDGGWHHVVAVRDAEAAVLNIFVDGVLEGTEPATYSAGFTAASAKLTMGMMAGPTGYWNYRGVLDEVVFYRRVLTSTEIVDHYESGVVGRGYFEEGDFAPTISSLPVTGGTVGQLYRYDVEASGSPVPGYLLESGPVGMVIDPVSGLLEWTPVAAGSFA
ncbi:LamG-like jellyroll fold domain-containing protein, partial [Desulfogranum mediterraneum]|uniref:LamG-like jellyroll fold domain-containing protein n=1 Tax=Desulfogranum mediterraneum TaxID=160661 RepID=UPI001376A2B8